MAQLTLKDFFGKRSASAPSTEPVTVEMADADSESLVPAASSLVLLAEYIARLDKEVEDEDESDEDVASSDDDAAGPQETETPRVESTETEVLPFPALPRRCLLALTFPKGPIVATTS
jgi:hypothetical protein